MARLIRKPDYDALAKSAGVRDVVKDAAEEYAANLRALEPKYPIEVYHQTTDRARASVQIAHPAGRAIQAKRGSITRAASQTGMQVNPNR